MSAEAHAAIMAMPQEVILERFRYKAITAIGPQVRDSMNVVTELDRSMDRMLMELQAEVYGKRGRECRKRIVATYPATWWDALKRDLERWVSRPQWILPDDSGLRRLKRWAGGRIGPHVARWLKRHPIRIDAKAVTLDFSERMLFPDNTVVIKGFGDPHFIQRITADVTDWGTDD